MNFLGRDHATIDLHLDGHGTSVELWSESAAAGAVNVKRVLVALDENHATALALALQAAVAEIQARAVGR